MWSSALTGRQRARSSRTSRKRPSTRMTVEALEDRALPAFLLPNFDFSMPDRFRDYNGDGRLDLPNTAEYANPSNGFHVDFDGTLTQGATAEATYSWVISGGGLPGSITLHDDGPQPGINLPEGAYSVRLTVDNGGREVASIVKTVMVRDILIVSIGDSVASGEGNPEVPGEFSYNNSVQEEWAQANDDVDGNDALNEDIRNEHNEAHRSTLSAHALTARDLELADPHTSVTFLSVAQSGASIIKGLFQDWAGGHDTDLNGHSDPPPPTLPGQLGQLANLVGNRRSDAMFLSVGANDIGLADIVHDLVLDSFLFTEANEEQIRGPFQAKLEQLKDNYPSLNESLHDRLEISDVYITEYMDITRHDPTHTCEVMLDGMFAGFHIDIDEATFAREEIEIPLNEAVESSAGQLGWHYVGGIFDAFAWHGYCAEETWIRDELESLALQGVP